MAREMLHCCKEEIEEYQARVVRPAISMLQDLLRQLPSNDVVDQCDKIIILLEQEP